MPGKLPRGTSFIDVELDQSQPINVEYVPGAQAPVRLVLAVQDRAGSKSGQETRPGATILGMSMKLEAALDIYSQIQKLAQAMDWPLPKEDEDQA